MHGEFAVKETNSSATGCAVCGCVRGPRCSRGVLPARMVRMYCNHTSPLAFNHRRLAAAGSGAAACTLSSLASTALTDF